MKQCKPFIKDDMATEKSKKEIKMCRSSDEYDLCELEAGRTKAYMYLVWYVWPVS